LGKKEETSSLNGEKKGRTIKGTPSSLKEGLNKGKGNYTPFP